MAEGDGSGARQLTKDGMSAQNPTATPDGQWIVYASGNPAHRGVWKIRPDGSGATQLVAATAVITDVSRDGRYVSYLVNRRTPMATIKVANVADGSDIPFSIAVGSQGRRGSRLTTGRTRWTADGKSITYIGQNEHGHYGVYCAGVRAGPRHQCDPPRARGLRRGNSDGVVCDLSRRKAPHHSGMGTTLQHPGRRANRRTYAAEADQTVTARRTSARRTSARGTSHVRTSSARRTYNAAHTRLQLSVVTVSGPMKSCRRSAPAEWARSSRARYELNRSVAIKVLPELFAGTLNASRASHAKRRRSRR